MMKRSVHTLMFPALVLVWLGLGAGQAPAFVGKIFKKPEKVVPTGEERTSQDLEAAAIYQKGIEAQRGGNGQRAIDFYDQVLKKYPFSQSAAEAAFAKATIIRETGKMTKAFEAFQRLVDDYRSSSRFNDAIEQQFELAEEAKSGKKQRSLVQIPMKLGSDDVIQMYRGIIKNAPFGKFAPMAQFSIAEVYQDRGDKGEAIAAYQAVVDNYPKSSQASEAQFRIGTIANIAANRSEDSSNLTATRDALTTYVAANPEGDRKMEAERILGQINVTEASKSLEVGKFYERMGKSKAAAIYYNEALKYGSAEASMEARERLAALSLADPEAVASVSNQPDQDFTIPAAVDLRGRDDYVGPPSPELAKLGEKARMRTEDDDFAPIPLQEPTLPMRSGDVLSTPGGGLLPPAPGGLVPLPPAEGVGIPPQPTAPLVPPAPVPPSPVEPVTPPAPDKPATDAPAVKPE